MRQQCIAYAKIRLSYWSRAGCCIVYVFRVVYINRSDNVVDCMHAAALRYVHEARPKRRGETGSDRVGRD